MNLTEEPQVHSERPVEEEISLDNEQLAVQTSDEEEETKTMRQIEIDATQEIENSSAPKVSKDKKKKLCEPKKFEYSKVGFIINPTAGKGKSGKTFGKKVYPLIKQNFAQGEQCFYETKKKGDAIRLAKKYLSQGYDYLISVGGDGTNNEVINGIMEFLNENESVQDFAVGFIPFGSGCDWERTLDLSIDNMEKVIDCLANAYIIPCDVGEVEVTEFESNNKIKKYFLNESSMGASGKIMQNVNKSMMIINPEITYTYHTLATSLFTKNTNLHLNMDNKIQKDIKSYTLSVHNGQYYGNNLWANPGGIVNDGKFNLLEFGDISFLELLKIVEELKTGTHLSLDKVSLKELVEVVEVTAPNSEGDVPVETDGELIGKLPATFKCIPSKIQIVVSKDFQPKTLRRRK
eukprot:gene2646-3843_t